MHIHGFLQIGDRVQTRQMGAKIEMTQINKKIYIYKEHKTAHGKCG